MFRNFLSCISVALLAFSCATTAQENTTVAQDPPPVKEVIVEKVLITKVVSKFPDGIQAGAVISTFDNDGIQTREETINGNGTMGEYKTFEKIPGGLKLSRFNSNKELQSKQELTLGSNDLLQKEVTFNVKDEVQSTSEYTYDEAGRVVTWTTKASQGNIKTAYFYDKGRLQKILQSDAQGKLIRQYIYIYDEAGILTAKNELEGDGQSAGQIKYTYTNGKLLKEDILNGKGALIRGIEYGYDDKGIVVKQIYTGSSGKVIEIKELEYKIIKKTISGK